MVMTIQKKKETETETERKEKTKGRKGMKDQKIKGKEKHRRTILEL